MENFMNYLITLLKGIMIGICNVIPGVSGGTLVVIFNIYDDFMDITSLNLKKIIQNRKFTIPFILGMGLGILGFSKLITVLFEIFPTQTYYFFTGLILGSIPLLFKYVFKNNQEKDFSALKIISLILGTLAGIAIIILFTCLQKKFGTENAVQAELPPITFPLMLRIFIAGFFGAIAMIIPGISGALLMLILGVYTIILAAISALFVPETTIHACILLLPSVLGILTGLVAGSNLLKFLLRNFPNYTYSVIFGLIIGSLYTICPGFKDINGAGCAIGCALSLLGGAALAFFSSKLGKEEANKDETNDE